MIIHLETIDSTNDFLFEKAKNENLPHGTLVFADTQTKGKGTKGRSFSSPEKTGIYMSVLIKGVSKSRLLLVTPLAGVVVKNCIEKLCGVQTKIKPVNDLFKNGRKVCGILAQAHSTGGECDFIVVGIGINLYKPENDFPEEIKSIAGYLLESESDFTLKEKLIKLIASELSDSALKLFDDEFSERIKNDYNSNLLEEYKEQKI